MSDNARIYYGCQALNLWSPDDKISSINGFLSGVQSVGVDSSFANKSIVDYGKPTPQRIGLKPEFTLTFERVIPKQGELFFKTDTDLISGLFDDGCPEHTILIIYGQDDESYVQDDKVNDLMLFENMVLKSLSYSIGTRIPALRESASFLGRIQKQDSDTIVGLVEPQYAGRTSDNPTHGMIGRADYVPHTEVGGSILPQTVEDWISYTAGLATDRQFYGLTSIDISFDINHKELTDVGKWRGAIASQVNRYNLPLLPVVINCSFKFNAKRSIRKDLLVTPDNFTDEEIKIVTGPFKFNLGPYNKLETINKSGGSTSGDSVEYEIRYSNMNYFRIDS